MNGTLAPFNWDTEVKKYDLHEITSGVVVMKRNANGRGPVSMNEPDHYLCPDCFAQMRKSYLQFESLVDFRVCHHCRHEYFWGARTEEAPRQPGPVPTSPALQKGFSRDSLSPAFREALKPRSLEQIVQEAVETDLEIQRAARKSQDALRSLAPASPPRAALPSSADPAPVHTLETLAELGKELAERAKGTMGPTLRYLGSDYLEAYAAVMEGRPAV